jgi:glutathione S-transferase
MTPRLITIPISHYCEKARWALARAGIAYREEAHLQVFHFRHVKRAGGGRSVPTLVTADGTFGDSTDILKWVDRQRPGSLYPADPSLRQQVEDLETDLDEHFGPATRRVVYHAMLPSSRLAIKYNNTGAPWHERALMIVVLPGLKIFLRKHLHIDEGVVQQDLIAIRKKFDEIGAKISQSKRFLIGDSFTAADLTFAALAAPMLLPDRYGVPLPRLDEVPRAYAAMVREFRDLGAGKYALRLYEAERIR